MQMRLCKECDTPISEKKKWGYVDLCKYCDNPEKINKSMAVMIADGKTDYHFQIVENPTDEQAESIRSAGTAHDPRTQLKAINKVSK